MEKFEQKVMQFAVALQDMYKDEEDRENVVFTKLELDEEELTEDFTAMFYAMLVFYKNVTGDNGFDAIDLVHLCNRLVVQHIMEDMEKCE